jgi:hypothetical protein
MLPEEWVRVGRSPLKDDDCADELKWEVQYCISGRCNTDGIKALMGGGYERSARYKAGEYVVFKKC